MPEDKTTPLADGKRELSVEESLQRLEMYVQTLEQGEIDLDQAFTAFEKAVKLSKKLKKKLEHYEHKIDIITKESKESGEFEIEGFSDE